MVIIEPDKQFEANAALGFGTVKVRFVTDVRWLELGSPKFAKMPAHGSAPGSAADLNGEMRLEDSPGDGTRMTWSHGVWHHPQCCITHNAKLQQEDYELIFRPCRGNSRSLGS